MAADPLRVTFEPRIAVRAHVREKGGAQIRSRKFGTRGNRQVRRAKDRINP
jgi:hypothetical protein